MRIWLLIALLFSSVCFAESRYIGGQSPVTLRSGHGEHYSALRSIAPGTSVQILDINPYSGYSKIRLPNGIEGFVPTHILTKKAPAPAKEASAAASSASDAPKTPLAELKEKLQEAQQEMIQLKEAHATQEQLNLSLKEENKVLNEQLASLADGMVDQDTLRQVDTLKKANNALKTEMHQLKIAYANVNKQSTYKWFITGAIITFGGVLLGLFAGSITQRRRRKFGS